MNKSDYSKKWFLQKTEVKNQGHLSMCKYLTEQIIKHKGKLCRKCQALELFLLWLHFTYWESAMWQALGPVLATWEWVSHISLSEPLVFCGGYSLLLFVLWLKHSNPDFLAIFLWVLLLFLFLFSFNSLLILLILGRPSDFLVGNVTSPSFF